MTTLARIFLVIALLFIWGAFVGTMWPDKFIDDNFKTGAAALICIMIWLWLRPYLQRRPRRETWCWPWQI